MFLSFLVNNKKRDAKKKTSDSRIFNRLSTRSFSHPYRNVEGLFIPINLHNGLQQWVPPSGSQEIIRQYIAWNIMIR